MTTATLPTAGVTCSTRGDRLGSGTIAWFCTWRGMLTPPCWAVPGAWADPPSAPNAITPPHVREPMSKREVMASPSVLEIGSRSRGAPRYREPRYPPPALICVSFTAAAMGLRACSRCGRNLRAAVAPQELRREPQQDGAEQQRVDDEPSPHALRIDRLELVRQGCERAPPGRYRAGEDQQPATMGAGQAVGRGEHQSPRYDRPHARHPDQTA